MLARSEQAKRDNARNEGADFRVAPGVRSGGGI